MFISNTVNLQFNDEEIIIMKGIFSKLAKNSPQIGFRKAFTTEELDAIKGIHHAFSGDEKPKEDKKAIEK